MKLTPAFEFLASKYAIGSVKETSEILDVPANFYWRLKNGSVKGLQIDLQARVLEQLAKYSGKTEFKKEANKLLSSLTPQKMQEYLEKSEQIEQKMKAKSAQYFQNPPELQELYA